MEFINTGIRSKNSGSENESLVSSFTCFFGFFLCSVCVCVVAVVVF